MLLTCPLCEGRWEVRAGTSIKGRRCPNCKAPLQKAKEPEPDEPGDERRSYAASKPAARRPINEPEPDAVEDVSVRRKRPPPVRMPLWLGVYDFPWQKSGLRAWFLFGIGYSLTAFMAAILHWGIHLHETTDFASRGIWSRVFQLFAPAFVFFLMWTSAFASGFFLATVNETGGGNRDIDWPDDSLGEKLFTFLGVAWIFALSAVPFGALMFPLKPLLGWRVFGWSFVPTAILVFPICLVGGLANGSVWQLWNWEFIRNFFAKPLVVITLYSMSAVILAPCLVLGYLTIVEYAQFIFLAPLTGFVWSAGLLIYGRLLGRVLWVVGGEHELGDRELRQRRKLKRLPTA